MSETQDLIDQLKDEAEVAAVSLRKNGIESEAHDFPQWHAAQLIESQQQRITELESYVCGVSSKATEPVISNEYFRGLMERGRALLKGSSS